jgi:3-hydroxyisobutyrate dehydrogenase-like beta-hydroxyacid dehydrogenase
MRVGFIGLGNMGLPMCRNILKAGLDLTVFNRTRAKADALAPHGARVASSAADVAEAADIVLSCLADVPASRDLFLGPAGLAASARPGQVLVDHATVDLATSLEVHAAARARGASFLDAPISGGPGGAADGALSIEAGGEISAFETARPAFEAMGKTIVLMGGPGAGTATKLTNQLLVSVHTVATCEALTLARKAGVDLEKLVHVLRSSWGASRMLERNAPRIIARDFGASAAPVRNLDKDLGIILGLAAEKGLRLPAAGAAGEFFRALNHAGWGERDIAAVAQRIEEGL